MSKMVEPDSDDGEIYDFGDWNAGDFPEADEWLRNNLRAAFKAFGDGHWTYLEERWDGALTWLVIGWDEQPVMIRFRPTDLRDGLSRSLRSLCADHTHTHSLSEPQRQDIKDMLDRELPRWRSALAAIEAEGKRLLALPPS
jgi:hypothetical protein